MVFLLHIIYFVQLSLCCCCISLCYSTDNSISTIVLLMSPFSFANFSVFFFFSASYMLIVFEYCRA